jgi:DNA replication protein DnaC
MVNPNLLDALQRRAQALRLNGPLEHWDEVAATEWVAPLIQWEEEERGRRSMQRRLRDAHLGKFRTLADFDWTWPKQLERAAVEELMSLAFMKDAMGP